jgi:hypothetical protein
MARCTQKEIDMYSGMGLEQLFTEFDSVLLAYQIHSRDLGVSEHLESNLDVLSPNLQAQMAESYKRRIELDKKQVDQCEAKIRAIVAFIIGEYTMCTTELEQLFKEFIVK